MCGSKRSTSKGARYSERWIKPSSPLERRSRPIAGASCEDPPLGIGRRSTMGTTSGNTWTTGWTADEPLAIGYVAVGRDEGRWETGMRPSLEYRNLGLDGVTDGKMGVQHIRSKEATSFDWHCH